MKTLRMLSITICFLFHSLSVAAQEVQAPFDVNEARIKLTKREKQVLVEAYIPRGITEFELQIKSDRNNPVSGAREISSTDPDPEARSLGFQKYPLDVRYPVVDIALETSRDGICVFTEEPIGDYISGGPFFGESLPLKKMINLPSHKLEYWENSLMLDHAAPKIERVYLRKTFPVILREFKHTFHLLSEDWSGRISIVVFKENDPIEIASARVENNQRVSGKAQSLEKMKGGEMSRKRLIAALDLLIEDGLRRQNNNPFSPTYGNLYAFYDQEAKLHRTSYWNWASNQ